MVENIQIRPHTLTRNASDLLRGILEDRLLVLILTQKTVKVSRSSRDSTRGLTFFDLDS